MSKKNASNQKGMAFMAGGLLLIVAALILTGYNLWDERRAENTAHSVLEQLSHTPDMMDMAKPPSTTSPSPGQEIPDYILNPDMEMPTDTVDGNQYIGVLTIPALELSLPIMADWSYPKLKIAPGRYQGSAYTDSLIIAGHNYRTHFGSLDVLSSGDEVVFTDVDGNRFPYIVAETEELKDSEVERMAAGDWDLTLFTCTLGGENRVTVRCVTSNSQA